MWNVTVWCSLTAERSDEENCGSWKWKNDHSPNSSPGGCSALSCRCNYKGKSPHGDRSFRPRVLLASRSLTSYVVPLRRETSAAHVYASYSHPWYKKVRLACIYLVLSATDQAKAVRELTQHVSEMTSEVSKQGPVARSLVSANRWLRGIKMYRFPWYLTLVSTNHASSNPG